MLYVMQAKLLQDDDNVVVDSDGELWHKRLGHINEREQHMLAEKDLLPTWKVSIWNIVLIVWLESKIELPFTPGFE